MFDIIPTAFIFFASAILVAIAPGHRLRSAITLLAPVVAAWQVYNIPAGVFAQKEIKAVREQLNKYLKPKIEIAFSKGLSKLANSCIDVSDGLLGDLSHICEQSKVGAELFLENIPLQGDHQTALTWGDDYQLCFTADSSKTKHLNQLAKLHHVKISKIGVIKNEKGVSVYSDGKELTIKKAGYNHFNE